MQGTRLPAGGLPPSSSRGLSGAWFGHHFPTLCRVVILTTISVTHGFFFRNHFNSLPSSRNPWRPGCGLGL